MLLRSLGKGKQVLWNAQLVATVEIIATCK